MKTKKLLIVALLIICANLVTSCKKKETPAPTPTPTPVNPFAVGQTYQGGKIAYVFQSGDPGYISGQTHGLIASPSDQGTSIQWALTYTLINSTATGLGTGSANTSAIVANQGAGNYASKLCDDLVLGGYSDWYLPSKDELNKIYLNKSAIGGFTSGDYLSSSESNINQSWAQDGTTGLPNGNFDKEYPACVRAIRTF